LAFASLIGIFLISFVSEQTELEFTNISEIDSGMLNEAVHFRGVVKEFKEFSAGVKMVVEQENSRVNLIYFEDIPGKKEMCADVIGEVKTNEGAVEIRASEVNLFIC